MKGFFIQRRFLFISHTTNVLLLKFRCNIFIGVRIIKEIPGSVASETHCTSMFLFLGHGTEQMWTRVGLSGAKLKIKIRFNTQPQLKSSFIFRIVTESSVVQGASLNLNPLIVYSLIIYLPQGVFV